MKEDILDVFGNNLKLQRSNKRLSQRDFSEKTAIDQSDISRMEHGQINITLKTLQQICDALDINFWELLVNRKK